MKRAILGVALAMKSPAQPFAPTVLCAESGSTGFNWREGKWPTDSVIAANLAKTRGHDVYYRR